jgi:hypothetical protein
MDDKDDKYDEETNVSMFTCLIFVVAIISAVVVFISVFGSYPRL